MTGKNIVFNPKNECIRTFARERSTLLQKSKIQNIPFFTALFVMIEMIIIVVGIVYLALNPARLFLMLIPKKGGRQLLSIDTRREIK